MRASGAAGSRRTFHFTLAGSSSIETVLLPEERSVRFALMMSSVRSETSLKTVPTTGITRSDWREIGQWSQPRKWGLGKVARPQQTRI